MINERGDMGDLNMVMGNIINNTCGIFFKMPAHSEDKFIYVRGITR